MKPESCREARIDVAREAGHRPRHLHDDVVAEPVEALLLGEQVDGGRVAARVDRPAHQRHGRRREAVALRLHQRHGGEHRHRRLADRHHMRIRAELVEHVDDVVDIVVEIELAFADRHHARVGPVGDVDVGIAAASPPPCRAAAWRSGRTSARRSEASGRPGVRPAGRARSGSGCRRAATRRPAPSPRLSSSRPPSFVRPKAGLP